MAQHGQSLRVMSGDRASGQLTGAKAEAVKELLVGSRKAWAKDQLEAVLAFRIEDHQAAEVAVLHLQERRVIARAEKIRLTETGAFERLQALLAPATGLVLRSQKFYSRAAVGRMLGAARVTTRPLEVTEVDLKGQTDYKDVLAGSAWLDMNIQPGRDDLFATALMTALQVRSLRRGCLETHKVSYYAVSAVKWLAQAGHSVEQIAEEASVPIHLAARWSGLKPSEPQAAADAPAAAVPEGLPATESQVATVLRLLEELPPLHRALPKDWKSNRKATSAFIARAIEILEAVRGRLRAVRSEREARLMLGAGRSLSQAANACDLDVDELSRLLASDFTSRLDDLAADLGRMLGAKLTSADLLEAS
ncbi:hypothetical protein [Rhodovibrio sodomensis]|uniref:hypothetical protein n=1 Tax=Rhodovibrio sodomensis TaxID=1088 RepID=UPI00190585C7|nr:hypothetical protein [Rhodovibrio sodomensis]